MLNDIQSIRLSNLAACWVTAGDDMMITAAGRKTIPVNGVTYPTGQTCNDIQLWIALFSILWGVGHVKVGHPHPSSCASTSAGHVTINLCGVSSFWPLNPVVPRGAALLYVLARKCRVLQGAILKLDGSLWKKTSYYLESSILLSEDSLLWGLYVQLELLLQSFCLELKFFPTHTLASCTSCEWNT